MLKIKVINEEYFSACEEGCVYGCVRGNSDLHVYSELGQEKKYDPPEWIKPQEGRIFVYSKSFFATSLEDLDSGIFHPDIYWGDVLIYL